MSDDNKYERQESLLSVPEVAHHRFEVTRAVRAIEAAIAAMPESSRPAAALATPKPADYQIAPVDLKDLENRSLSEARQQLDKVLQTEPDISITPEDISV